MQEDFRSLEDFLESFNPSNGIGVVHAGRHYPIQRITFLFQSLKRDRGGSCQHFQMARPASPSFNPSNGIGVVHAQAVDIGVARIGGFNPSNGIGVVHARNTMYNPSNAPLFQSLKRDRGGSCGSRIWLSFSHFTIDSKQKAGGFGKEKPVYNAKSHHFQYSSPTAPDPARGNRRPGGDNFTR